MNNRLSKTFYGNTIYTKRLIGNMTDEDMLLSTGESNTIGWILGHINYYRGEIARKMKKDCELKEIEKTFERGAPKNKELKINLTETLNDFSARGDLIASAIEELSGEQLKQQLDIELPGGDNSVETYLAFLSWHETFHIGQIDLIKAALGKGGVK
jgi:uncharacterized damage-inducible protein DinB